MKAEQTPLKDCYLIHDTLFEDDRGYFFESFNAQKFAKETGIDIVFVQDNQSRSSRGVLRGLHFQLGKFSQAKLVRVLRGEVLDVAVDLRKSSPTYGQHYSVVLSEKSKTQFFVPRGFAHGFVVLSDSADFFYKCDNFYDKQSESGIIYNDPMLNINWQLKDDELIISDKDKVLALFNRNKEYFGV